jgi:hypothetical protein
MIDVDHPALKLLRDALAATSGPASPDDIVKLLGHALDATGTKLVDHEAGLRAARRYTGWFLGDPSWANNVVNAYLNPAASNARLDVEEGPPEKRARKAASSE